MVSEITTYEINTDGDFTQYFFELGGNIYNFDVMNFNGIDEYNSLLKEDDLRIFNKIEKIKHKIYKVAAYDWDLEKKNPDVDIFKLIRIIEWIGKDYIMRFWPDIIFYEAEDIRLHRIYRRMFYTAGYDYLYNIGNHHIYLRNFGSPFEIT